MPNIPKVKIGNTEYNIKDQEARNQINANGVMNYPHKNLIADPLFLNQTVDANGEMLADDAGNIIHFINTGSPSRAYIALKEPISSGNTLYIQMLLKGSAASLIARVSGIDGSTTTKLKEFYTDTKWMKVSDSVDLHTNVGTIMLALPTVGECWIKGLIVSTSPIDYDFTVKETVKKVDALAESHEETLNGRIGLENFNSYLNNVFAYEWNAISLAFESGYINTDGTLNTYTGYHTSITVHEGDRIKLSSEHGFDMKMFVLLDSNNVVYEYYPTDRVSTKVETKEIIIQYNGTIKLNTYSKSNCSAKMAGGISVVSSQPLSGKTWYALGDSITEYDMGYHAIIEKQTGVVVTNGGVSGSGYMKPINNKTFVDRANLSSVYDIVTVMGSVNDMSYVAEHLGTESDTGTETIGGSFNTLIDNLYASGNYHIGIIAPIPQNSQSGNPANTTGSFAQYTELLEKVCKRRGVPYLDLWHCSNMQPWDEDFAETYMQDDTHPNADGHAIFAPRIKAFIESL